MINFLLGLIFAYLILPLLQLVANYCQSRTELANYKIIKQVSVIKKEIGQLQGPEEQELCNPIGFQINDVTEEDEEE